MKILSTILQRRLANLPNIISDYQYRFTRDQSTIDAIHMLKQLIKNGRENNINLEILFLDFQQAFDRIRRKNNTSIRTNKKKW